MVVSALPSTGDQPAPSALVIDGHAFGRFGAGRLLLSQPLDPAVTGDDPLRPLVQDNRLHEAKLPSAGAHRFLTVRLGILEGGFERGYGKVFRPAWQCG